MSTFLPYIQITLSLLLIIGVLLQHSEEGLGSAFGASDSTNARFTRRGFEKMLFHATLIVAALFVLSAFANLFVGRY
jgi:protein translocase SecG subunit